MRQQDGDLKYIMIFNCPEAALLWCIVVQECLMYVDWPMSSLRHWGTEWNAEGRTVFRGPRCGEFEVENGEAGRESSLGGSYPPSALWHQFSRNG